MSDDQALIEDFIAKNGVKKIPTGVSGTYPDYKWDGKTLAPRVSRHWRNIYQSGPKISPEVARRRLRVVELAQEGKTARQIADHLGVDVDIIYHDTKVTGIKTASPNRVRKGGTSQNRAEAKAANREAVREAFDGKTSANDIAAKLGLGRSTVRRHLADLGLTCPPVSA